MGHWSWSSDTFVREDMTRGERENRGEGVREENRGDMSTRQHILRLMLYRYWR
jgi:hypothetical protein